MSEIPEGYRILVAVVLAIVFAFAIFGAFRGLFENFANFVSFIRPK